MRPLTIVLSLLLLGFSCIAQMEERVEIKSLNRQLIKRKDTVYRFYADFPDHPVHIYPNRLYFWFQKDTILTTVGGYDGRLLDGSYTVFYPDRNLAVSGEFTDGLRTGEWRSWYAGGRIRSIVHWRRGLESGPFTEFDSAGGKSREGVYRDGVLSGKIRVYAGDGTYRTIEYKDGMALDEPEKKKDKKDKKEKEPGYEE